MTDDILFVSETALARILGIPIEAARERIRARVASGEWTLDPPAGDEAQKVAIAPAALNRELDCLHGAWPRPEPDSGAGAPERAEPRSPALIRLLRQAQGAIEDARHRLGQSAEREARLNLAQIEAKQALVAAYDRILALQMQLAQARESLEEAREARQAVAEITAIIARIRNAAG